jgi:hypothetical protein
VLHGMLFYVFSYFTVANPPFAQVRGFYTYAAARRVGQNLAKYGDAFSPATAGHLPLPEPSEASSWGVQSKVSSCSDPRAQGSHGFQRSRVRVSGIAWARARVSGIQCLGSGAGIRESGLSPCPKTPKTETVDFSLRPTLDSSLIQT